MHLDLLKDFPTFNRVIDYESEFRVAQRKHSDMMA